MASQTEPLVHFYDLAGPDTWSPSCWHTRFALAYKGIPYKTTKLSYPDIKPTCERLFGADFADKGLKATVPIIEILPSSIHKTAPQALNDSIPIAKLLNQVFTPELGFKHLEGIEEAEKYQEVLFKDGAWTGIWLWTIVDVWANTLKGDVRGQEFVRSTRESKSKCTLEEVMEVKGGGEEKVVEMLRKGWVVLKERMAKEDGNGERELFSIFLCFFREYILCVLILEL